MRFVQSLKLSRAVFSLLVEGKQLKMSNSEGRRVKWRDGGSFCSIVTYHTEEQAVIKHVVCNICKALFTLTYSRTLRFTISKLDYPELITNTESVSIVK